MKIQDHDYGFESELPAERIAFTIKNSAKLFGILSSGIYKNKIMAVIRELSCNAYDAHIAAKKKTTPFRIRLPNRMDPTFYVEDEGTGIDPDKIKDIYWTYGESTKTESNDQIGALGLGSKSPFAYTKSSFVVKNRYEGTEHIYLCFINESGKPDGSKVSEEPTDLPSGITVEFAVRLEDIEEFRTSTAKFFRRWASVMPTFVDTTVAAVMGSTPIEKILDGTDWYLEKKLDASLYVDHAGAIALQGNVPYPIELSSIPKLPKELAIIAGNPFIITFQMGEVNFAASRESLEYDERTRSNVISRLQEVKDEIMKTFESKIFKPNMTHLQFVANFKSTFSNFIATVRYDAGYKVNTDDMYLELLLGKNKDDTINYGGVKWSLSGLVSGHIEIKIPKHQSFGLSTTRRRSSHSNYFQNKTLSTLEFTAIADITDPELIEPSSKYYISPSRLKKDSISYFDWRSTYVSTRGERSDFTKYVSNATLFTMSTKHEIKLAETMKFVVNDVGTSGDTRFKLLRSDHIFVNFDHRVTKLEDVLSELDDLISRGLSGSEVTLLSNYNDLRPVIDKVKLDVGTIKASINQLHFEEAHVPLTVYTGVSVEARYLAYKNRTVAAVLKIADLQAMEVVPYVVKSRSKNKVYDDFKTTASIITDHILMTLAAMYAWPELINRTVDANILSVMVLNEGQVTWMQNKGIKVVSLRTLLRDRIQAIQDKEQFIDAVNRSKMLSNVKYIKPIYELAFTYKLTDAFSESPDSTVPSLFKKTFSEYRETQATNNNLADAWGKSKLFNDAGLFIPNSASDNSNRITKLLQIHYPMLHIIAFGSNLFSTDAKQSLKILLEYIETVDSQNLVTEIDKDITAVI